MDNNYHISLSICNYQHSIRLGTLLRKFCYIFVNYNSTLDDRNCLAYTHHTQVVKSGCDECMYDIQNHSTVNKLIDTDTDFLPTLLDSSQVLVQFNIEAFKVQDKAGITMLERHFKLLLTRFLIRKAT